MSLTIISLRVLLRWLLFAITSINGISEVYHRFALTFSSKYPAVISPFFHGVYLALHIPSSRRIFDVDILLRNKMFQMSISYLDILRISNMNLH